MRLPSWLKSISPSHWWFSFFMTWDVTPFVILHAPNPSQTLNSLLYGLYYRQIFPILNSHHGLISSFSYYPVFLFAFSFKYHSSMCLLFHNFLHSFFKLLKVIALQSNSFTNPWFSSHFPDFPSQFHQGLLFSHFPLNVDDPQFPFNSMYRIWEIFCFMVLTTVYSLKTSPLHGFLQCSLHLRNSILYLSSLNVYTWNS